MENVLSFLTSLEDSEIEAMLIFLKEYVKSRNVEPKLKTQDITYLINKRMKETTPKCETHEEFEKRKRDIKWEIQYNFI